jgi:peptide/nickel transport system permease protein
MRLGSFILRRIFHSIFVLIGLSIVIFIIARIVPGDPARMALGPRAPQEVVDRLRQEMYLDKPLPEQYYYWIKGVLVGDFGRSLFTNQPVLKDVEEYLPATIELVITATIIAVFFAILLGTLAARHRDRWLDTLIRILAYLGIAIPPFVVAVLLVLLFGYTIPILPVFGRFSAGIPAPPHITGMLVLDSLLSGNFVALGDSIKHLILPALALSLGGMFQDARITRASMVDNINKDYLAAERGYGIPESTIMFKYLLKPSLIPTVSVMGMEFGTVVANAFLVELIFNWPGISRYGINAMLTKDLNAISAVILIIGFIFIVMNILVDIIVAFLDPRIRLSETKGT